MCELQASVRKSDGDTTSSTQSNVSPYLLMHDVWLRQIPKATRLSMTLTIGVLSSGGTILSRSLLSRSLEVVIN
jgi:hypothetical protein